MKKEVKDALNTLKTFLGMEVKLEQMKLVDGVTTIEFDILEAGQSIMIVNEEDRVPLPIGEYELQDGQILKVLEDGVIGEIGAKQEEVEQPEQPEVEEEAPKKGKKKAGKAKGPKGKKGGKGLSRRVPKSDDGDSKKSGRSKRVSSRNKKAKPAEAATKK